MSAGWLGNHWLAVGWVGGGFHRSEGWRKLLLLLGLYFLFEEVGGVGGISSNWAGVVEWSTGNGCRRGLQVCGHIYHEGQDVAELEAGMNVCFIEDRHQRKCAGVFGSEVGQVGIFVEDADFEAGRAGEVEVKEDFVGCQHVVLEVDGVH